MQTTHTTSAPSRSSHYANAWSAKSCDCMPSLGLRGLGASCACGTSVVRTEPAGASTHNHLLASLPDSVAQQMKPHLERVELRRATVLFDTGAQIKHVYFPTTAIVSLVAQMKDGASSEVAVVGNEGLVGVCAFMSRGRSLSSAVVEKQGYAMRMSAEAIANISTATPVVMQTLLNYTQALFTQVAQTAACICHHTVEQRLCRWLLLNHDRVEADELVATQERVAQLLGVRRESVTGAALALRNTGAIRYARGRISIVDRQALERRSCECYAVIKQAYASLPSVSCPPARAAASRPTSVFSSGYRSQAIAA